MSAVMSRPDLASSASQDDRSIDDLDRAICCLVRQMNAESYRMLVLVREFDDRFGWAKWTFKCCAEWLAWRCGISLSAARERRQYPVSETCGVFSELSSQVYEA